MKFRYLALCGLFVVAYTSAGASEHKECEIEFKLNSSVVLKNQKSLDSCLESLNPSNIEAVTVVGSASISGPKSRNRVLAHERSLMLERIVKAKFPNVPVKVLNLGPNEDLGKNSQINFVLKSADEVVLEADRAKMQENMQVLQQQVTNLEGQLQVKEQALAVNEDINLKTPPEEKVQEEKSFSEKNPNLRAALRVGVDSTRVANQRNYLSGGGEIAWLNRDSNFRPEIGVKSTVSIDGVKINNNSVSRVTNVYGFLGAGASAQGFVTGVRILGGQEWINIDANTPNQDQFALGGEARLGYEWKRGISLFASYALTEHLQMAGLDIGISI